MILFIAIIFTVAILEAALAMGVSFVHKLGDPGKWVADALIKTPMLDVMLGFFSWIPWIMFGLSFGKRGLFGAMIGQIIALHLWVAGHEYVYREAVKGPRIVKAINRLVGKWRNYVALWVSAIAFPGFLVIRFMEVAVYPPLCWLLRFPKIKQSEWVTISRQKFTGLVGHDLIWCLYCDWMTGVYSLGAEQLRNVESFWCPIRFYDGKKCDNCKMDFPDINGGWVPADGTMQQVEDKLDEMYAGPGDRAWFGHPVRLTVKGK